MTTKTVTVPADLVERAATIVGARAPLTTTEAFDGLVSTERVSTILRERAVAVRALASVRSEAEARAAAPAIDAGAKLIATWLGYAWDGLVEARSSERPGGNFPIFYHHSQFGWKFQGGRQDLRDLAAAIVRAAAPASAMDQKVAAARARVFGPPDAAAPLLLGETVLPDTPQAAPPPPPADLKAATYPGNRTKEEWDVIAANSVSIPTDEED